MTSWRDELNAIVGARHVRQLEDTLRAGGWRLPDATLERLNLISAPPKRYPVAFEESMVERRAAAVKRPAAP